MTRLKGRIALVTGGSRGVGRGVALRLAAEGAAVAVNFRRDEESAREAVAEIEAAGGVARAFRASVDDSAALATMVDAVRSELGPVDLLVSNAGEASRGRSIADTSSVEFERLMRVHALGPLELIRLLLPDMRAAERADIAVVSSVIAAKTPPNCAPYTMAKAALETAARTLAREERGHGIRVNIVAPGLVLTDMGERLAAAATGGSIADLDARYPFGRVARPYDIANVIAFLASAEAEYLTGQKIEVDAGGPDDDIF